MQYQHDHHDDFDDVWLLLMAHFGTAAALGELLSMRRNAIQQWKYNRQVPAEQAIRIESMTDGRLKALDLRPDLSVKPLPHGALFPQPQEQDHSP